MLIAYTDKEVNVSFCNIEFCQEYAPGLTYSSYRPSWKVGAMGTMYKRVRENVKNDNLYRYKEDCVAGIHQIQLGLRCNVFPVGNFLCAISLFSSWFFLYFSRPKKY